MIDHGTLTCSGCSKRLKRNFPGIDTREAPYYTHNDGDTTRYLCSADCMSAYLDRSERAQPVDDETHVETEKSNQTQIRGSESIPENTEKFTFDTIPVKEFTGFKHRYVRRDISPYGEIISNGGNTVGVLKRNEKQPDIQWLTAINPELVVEWSHLLYYLYGSNKTIEIGVSDRGEEPYMPPELIAGYPEDDYRVVVAPRVSSYATDGENTERLIDTENEDT